MVESYLTDVGIALFRKDELYREQEFRLLSDFAVKFVYVSCCSDFVKIVVMYKVEF